MTSMEIGVEMDQRKPAPAKRSSIAPVEEIISEDDEFDEYEGHSIPEHPAQVIEAPKTVQQPAQVVKDPAPVTTTSYQETTPRTQGRQNQKQKGQKQQIGWVRTQPSSQQQASGLASN